MGKTSRLQILGALALGTALVMPAYAAEKAKGPASVDEGAPDKTGKTEKGAAGVATMPAKGPSSVNEGAPAKTGKDPVAASGTDSKKMANPKTPSSVNEGAPDKTGKGADKAERAGMKKGPEKY